MSYISIFMMSVAITYSVPIENSTVTLNSTSISSTSNVSTTLDKPILRNLEDNTPGKCCTDPSKKCCPYDYDANKCESIESRKLCGYNKNQKKPDSAPVHVTKMGLDCKIVEERVECGYEKGPEVANLESKTGPQKS
ncbi:uncharacterized protein LOC125234510 [Leguminivora glycinivorella]|uniref:uncharacterized protein LOC125234510 n=1 Tax=Leguminivora glycinivorella TaxID=1035111 RepID=UPI00200D4968|nr:uncharacterized protein LOC125234510 [Leguminivora glycinivorella]